MNTLPAQPARAPRRARIAHILLAVGFLLIGLAAINLSVLAYIGLGMAIGGFFLHPEPIRLRFQPLSIRPLLPILIPTALLLLLGIYHAAALADFCALLITAAVALRLALLPTAQVARHRRVIICLAQGLFCSMAYTLLILKPANHSTAPYLFIAIALLIEAITITPSPAWPRTAVLTAQAAALLACFLIFDPAWPTAILLPPMLLPTLAKPITRIPYSIGRLSAWVCIAFVWLFSIAYLSHIIDAFFVGHPQSRLALPTHTRNGNPYLHDTLSRQKENGYYLNTYICKSELASQWPTRSSIPLDALSPKGRTIQDVLIHYLTSLDLRKDSVGIAQLSPRDIQAIENGIYNANLVGKGYLYNAAWHELEKVELYLQSGSPTSCLTDIANNTIKAYEALGKAPTLGIGIRQVTSDYPNAISLVAAPLAIGVVPTLLLLTSLLTAACLAFFCSTTPAAAKSPRRHLGLTALSITTTAILCSNVLLEPVFLGIIVLLIALAIKK